jgi:hypothetical protein
MFDSNMHGDRIKKVLGCPSVIAISCGVHWVKRLKIHVTSAIKAVSTTFFFSC